MKKIVVALLPLAWVITAKAQTLFTYGNKAVSKTEFIKAFDKNPGTDTNRNSALKEYLNLYINFKLKLQAAYDENLQNDESYKTESEGFKNQLAETVLNEEANINELVNEAFARSQKDIEVAQVFIEVPKGADTAAASQKIAEAYGALQNGEAFENVSAKFSSDEATRDAKGNIGFVTVFTLPYAIENVVYGLHNGSYSPPIRSSVGYHIFKRLSDRPALGKRKIAQILLATPASFTPEEKQATAATADSVYNMLLASAPFDEMAATYNNSSDVNRSNNVEVSVGDYAPDFEKQVFALQNVGDISKPFRTAYGYHIIKLLEKLPVSTDANDLTAKALLQEAVERDERLAVAKKNLVTKWMELIHYKPAAINYNELWAYTDSFFNHGSFAKFKFTKSTPVFYISTTTVTLNDWLPFVTNIKQSGDALAAKTYPEIFKAFTEQKSTEYYKAHLFEYNEALRKQLQEFDEANLLFAVMDKHVWGKAADDTLALQKYYAAHKNNYLWQPGVSAIVVTANTKEVANQIAEKIKADAKNWRNIITLYPNNVQADSSRFEYDQLPVQQTNRQVGSMSPLQQNSTDNSWSFVYVTALHPNKEQRSFDDARGLVINDYQQVVEKNWINTLKKKYPVKVNQAVFATIK